jgi:hypothetical protein
LGEGNVGAHWFYSNKKASTGLQVSTEEVEVHFEQRFGLAKKIPALVNLWAINMNGKTN